MHLETATHRPAEERHDTPLLFVHGAWHASWCWDEHFIPFFTDAGFTCHTVDLRGHGASENVRSLRRTRIDHYVDDLTAAFNRVGSEPVVIAHSMGALVAQRFLEEHILPATVLLAPVPVGGALRATGRVARRHPWAFLKTVLTFDLGALIADDEVAADLLLADDLDDSDRERHVARMEGEAYLAYLDMLFFRKPRPERVSTPTLVIGGDADRIFSTKELHRTAAAYHSDAVVVPGTAHDVMLDPRWRSAAETILGWVQDRIG